MPKMKTHQGIKKRVKVTSSGKLMRRHASGNHFLEKKQQSRKRQYAKEAAVNGRTKKNVNRMLG